MGRRVLITGLATYWGGRMAQALEADPDVEVIIGLDTRQPQVKLERTEYVRSDENYSILSRIVAATKVDQVVDVFYVRDITGQKVDAADRVAAVREAVMARLPDIAQQRSSKIIKGGIDSR